MMAALLPLFVLLGRITRTAQRPPPRRFARDTVPAPPPPPRRVGAEGDERLEAGSGARPRRDREPPPRASPRAAAAAGRGPGRV